MRAPKSARASQRKQAKAARKDIQAAHRYVQRCFRQFALFTRVELDAGAALVADHYHANQGDRSLAAKFLLITTALNDCSQGHQPSALKRYIFLPGNTEHFVRHFLADPFELSRHVSDQRMLALIETSRGLR